MLIRAGQNVFIGHLIKFLFSARRYTGLSCLILLLSGCGGSGAYVLGPQQWDDVKFVVEIRPGAPTRGMNEFLVIATNTNGVPGYQYVISLRFKGSDKWIQSIQDGHSGVYRRAINVSDPVDGVLQIQVQNKTQQEKATVLEFPLSKDVRQ